MATAAARILTISPIDRLGEIRAKIADLKEIETFLIDKIRSMGEGAHDGDAYRAAVSTVADRKTLDPKAAEAKLRDLGVDGRWFSKNQKLVKGYITVRVSARKP